MTPELTALALAARLQALPFHLFAIAANIELGTAFTAAAGTEALLPAPDTAFESVRPLCAADPDRIDRVNRLDFINLGNGLPKGLE